MNSYKYLFKNIGLLTIGSLGTKLLTFFLVPLYTYALTTTEYGSYDILNSTINLLIPILTLNIAESVLRFSLDKKANISSVLKTGIVFLLKGTVIIVLLLCVNHFFSLWDILDTFALEFLLLFIVTAAVAVMNNFTRGIDKIVDISIAGIIGSGTIILLNIMFLLVLKIGLSGYFWSHIIGLGIQSLYLIIRAKAWNHVSCKTDKNLSKEMTQYSSPLVVNSIGWWINGVSARYIVTWFCGYAINGIYSVAYKIPSIIEVFQNIFFQAWTISAVKDFDADDKTGFFSQMYNIYNMCLVVLCSIIIIGTKVLAAFLYSNEFYAAWQYVPFLVISVVFGALSGYLGGIFTAVKNSKLFAQSTLVGAVINLSFSFCLVYFFGAMGAAIASMISYFAVWLMRLIHTRRYIKLRISFVRDGFVYCVLVIQGVLVNIGSTQLIYLLEVFLLLLILVMFYKEITQMYKKAFGYLSKKNQETQHGK